MLPSRHPAAGRVSAAHRRRHGSGHHQYQGTPWYPGRRRRLGFDILSGGLKTSANCLLHHPQGLEERTTPELDAATWPGRSSAPTAASRTGWCWHSITAHSGVEHHGWFREPTYVKDRGGNGIAGRRRSGGPARGGGVERPELTAVRTFDSSVPQYRADLNRRGRQGALGVPINTVFDAMRPPSAASMSTTSLYGRNYPGQAAVGGRVPPVATGIFVESPCGPTAAP